MAEARYKRKWRRDARIFKSVARLLDLYLAKSTFVFSAEMSKRTREARIHSGLSQKKFGEKLRLSQVDMYRLETGKLSQVPLTGKQFMSILPEYYHYILAGGFLMPRKIESPSINVWLDNKNMKGEKRRIVLKKIR